MTERLSARPKPRRTRHRASPRTSSQPPRSPTDPFLAEAAEKARLVYGFGENERVEPAVCSREEASQRSGARNSLVYTYAHAIPNDEALDALVELSPIVELGAGGGYWASLLQERGADVLALDRAVEDNEYAGQHYTRVMRGDDQELRWHADRTLFLCWPLGDLTAEWCLEAYGGDTVAYVGEHEGGCCATRGFFALLERDFTLERTIDIPRFHGMQDYMTIWRRRYPV